MNIQRNASLQQRNSFAVDSKTPLIYFVETENDIKSLAENLPDSFYILGEGSNTLFIDDSAPAIICPQFKGISATEHDNHYLLEVGAGENWHQLVCHCVENNMPGLENLALIPGSVGAAPVQNIGAYGVEFADLCESINWFEFSTKKLITMKVSDCAFAYRDSIFKGSLKNKGIITKVNLRLSKIWQPKLSYSGLEDLSVNDGIQKVMNRVISIREKKLPNPATLPNAGSFFKNPIVSEKRYQQLLSKFDKMPNFPLENNQVKLAAGWLIEQAGLKGYEKNGVGVHQHQALVLVNFSSKTGLEILKLSQYVQLKVQDKFGITLEPEVRMVSANGEILPKGKAC